MKPELIVKIRVKPPHAHRCDHCGVRDKWERTSKLVNCVRSGHPISGSANDHGVWGCWLCPACAEPYPVAPNALSKRVRRKLAQAEADGDQLNMFD